MRILLTISMLLMIGAAVSFGQSNAEASNAKGTEDEASVQKTQKVSEVRKVFVATHPSTVETKAEAKARQTTKEVKYDKKGGIIVPDASKGIRIIHQSKKANLGTVQQKSETASPAKPAKIERDLKAKQRPSASNKDDGGGAKK